MAFSAASKGSAKTIGSDGGVKILLDRRDKTIEFESALLGRAKASMTRPPQVKITFW